MVGIFSRFSVGRTGHRRTQSALVNSLYISFSLFKLLLKFVSLLPNFVLGFLVFQRYWGLGLTFLILLGSFLELIRPVLVLFVARFAAFFGLTTPIVDFPLNFGLLDSIVQYHLDFISPDTALYILYIYIYGIQVCNQVFYLVPLKQLLMLIIFEKKLFCFYLFT